MTWNIIWYYIFLTCLTVTDLKGIVANELNATFKAQKTSTILWISCYPSNISDIDTVYFITVSKQGFGDIVTIRDANKIEWKNTDFQNRVSIIGSMVTPVKNAILTINISNANIKCTDSGIYSCSINGFGFGNRRFEQSAMTQVNACSDVTTSFDTPAANSRARKADLRYSYVMEFSLLILLCLVNT